ncbi:MAG: deoxyribodipyrimidine photolyase [Bacteroidetes bacterium QH_2_64_74]|nr:MAG: deoxyribodipyrimidine photolyase [Bacteroidetes bacterium QH_2_64_74]
MANLVLDRVQPLNDRGLRAEGRYVLYWMQQSQRARHNPALERALRHANAEGLPLLVVFGLMDDYPEANLRHYTFMLEGLRETEQRLADRGLQMVVCHGAPDAVALQYAEEAAVLVTDRGYLRHQKQWRSRVAVEAVTDRLDLDRSVAPVSNLYPGGASEAEQILDHFLGEHLDGYDGNRNQIQTRAVSHMSKYLHFGQISPVWLARQVRSADGPDSDIESYIEELVVRRELAMNHVHFRPDTYDAYECLPEWARESLAEHADDEREHIYSHTELEQEETHDPYWNAAMKEMRETGYMHNYMRMYWGKKILEWSPNPQTAFDRTLHLNNKYFLDGRDPNSFANVAWIFGLHDRGWKERPVYGKVRYMSQGGLERKADPDAYVEKVDRLAADAQSP